MSGVSIDMARLRAALEASWDEQTSYRHVSERGNPALGQCYPTAWLVQQFFPEMEIVEGRVKTLKGVEKHFWNILSQDGKVYHFDFTWQQFPHGSAVQEYWVRDRHNLGDGPATVARCRLLRERVLDFLSH